MTTKATIIEGLTAIQAVERGFFLTRDPGTRQLVPITLIDASAMGSVREGRTPDCAARWNTISGRCRSKSCCTPSARTSMLKNVNSLP